MENYFESQRDQIFRNVQVLIYVFDVENNDVQHDLALFHRCLDALIENSKDAQIFCLIHKMDLIQNFSERQRIFRLRTEQLTSTVSDTQITCFGTSIWDETLYKAWSAIAYSLVPNVDRLRDALYKLCRLCNADEVVLFEQVTFLVISSAENPSIDQRHHDVHRYEKMSNIIKQFKLSCNTMKVSFRSIQVHNTYYSAYMDIFTPTTYIMVICSEPKLTTSGIQINISAARKIFDNLMSSIQ